MYAQGRDFMPCATDCDVASVKDRLALRGAALKVLCESIVVMRAGRLDALLPNIRRLPVVPLSWVPAESQRAKDIFLRTRIGPGWWDV
jgi:hypothetical protein